MKILVETGEFVHQKGSTTSRNLQVAPVLSYFSSKKGTCLVFLQWCDCREILWDLGLNGRRGHTEEEKVVSQKESKACYWNVTNTAGSVRLSVSKEADAKKCDFVKQQ